VITIPFLRGSSFNIILVIDENEDVNQLFIQNLG